MAQNGEHPTYAKLWHSYKVLIYINNNSRSKQIVSTIANDSIVYWGFRQNRNFHRISDVKMTTNTSFMNTATQQHQKTLVIIKLWQRCVCVHKYRKNISRCAISTADVVANYIRFDRSMLFRKKLPTSLSYPEGNFTEQLVKLYGLTSRCEQFSDKSAIRKVPYPDKIRKY